MTTHSHDWLQHVFQPSSWNPREQSKWILLMAGFLVLFAGIVYVLQISAVASKRHNLDELLSQRNALEREIEMLRQAISAGQNLAELKERATVLGFRRASNEDIRYLNIDGYQTANSASVNKIVTHAFLTDAEPVVVHSVDWLTEFRQQWLAFAAP